MKIEDILLKKEELPILYETSFYIPIHPKLLSQEIRLDKNLARNVFPQATEDWYKDLSEYANTLEDAKTKEWIMSVFLKEKPKIKEEYGRQVLNTLNWHNDISISNNGFARCFSINRNIGGSLYFNQGEYEFEHCISLQDNLEGSIRFSEEKLKEFAKTIANFGNEKKAQFLIFTVSIMWIIIPAHCS